MLKYHNMIIMIRDFNVDWKAECDQPNQKRKYKRRK